MFQFFTNYAKDGQTAVTLQANGQDMQYLVQDISKKETYIVPLSVKMPQEIYEEVQSVAELVWPTQDEYIVKFGFRPVSEKLKKFLITCWKEMVSKEACLTYMLIHFQNEFSVC